MSNSRKYSSVVIDGYERAASRAMLYPVGFKKEDFKKPQVGIASTWSMVKLCQVLKFNVTGIFIGWSVNS